MSNCIQCSDFERSNQHRLHSCSFPITYEPDSINEHFSLPRRYTCVHSQVKRTTADSLNPRALDDCVSLSVGHNYDRKLLSSSNDHSGIIGKWVKNGHKQSSSSAFNLPGPVNDLDDRYEIHLKVLISTKDYPDAASRNKTICKDLGIVLEGIAFAETTLLEKYQHLGNSRVLIHFSSIDENYDRVENWHRLKYWSQDYVESDRRSQDKSQDKSHRSDRDKKKKKKHTQRRLPQMCATCRK